MTRSTKGGRQGELERMGGNEEEEKWGKKGRGKMDEKETKEMGIIRE